MRRESRSACWFSMTHPAVAMIAIAIAGSTLALVVARLRTEDACLEAGFQGSCTTAVECLCQVGAHILSSQFTTGTGFIMAHTIGVNPSYRCMRNKMSNQVSKTCF